ncbi:MAG: histidine kinase [Chitinophagales bacterium]|nr:histidine kinase [Chitinophagales bacterium]
MQLTIFQLIILVFFSLLFAVAGVYLMARFTNLFKKTIKNELLRKNVVAWLIIFCISSAMTPMSGGSLVLLAKWGWGWAIIASVISTTVATLIAYNSVRLIAESKRLKRLGFVLHNAILMVVLIITTLMVHIPTSIIVWGNTQYLKNTIVGSVYLAGIIGIVYAVINLLDIERKRKFDAKELEVSRLQELKAKAELEALHSKVNPHFLYNALNSIADLSITDGKKARKMTIALADLFRYSINYSNNNYSTIRDELEMTNVYLEIEKIRFEDKLNYSIHVDEELNHYLVPRFVIQPLVENAVKHGLKATGKMTEIKLDVKKADGGILIEVEDTGPPFPDQLNPGYGVKSVFDKMEMLFPDQFEIRFINTPQKKVSIYIKKMIKNEPVV